MSITSSLNKESYARYLVDEKGLSVTDAKREAETKHQKRHNRVRMLNKMTSDYWRKHA